MVMTKSKQPMIICMIVAKEATYETGGNTKKMSTNIPPAMNSTSGYCQEILLLQFLHLPRRAKKLSIGKRSNQEIVLPQDIHFERPPMPMPVLNRKETTFKKLPTMAPKRKATIEEKRSTDVVSN